MTLKARMLKHDDYDTLVKWWGYWRFPVPAREFLPEDGTFGVILEDESGLGYCAGFLYETNSDVAWMEYIVSNPEIKVKGLRKLMLELLIAELINLADDGGFQWIFTSLKHPSLMERYESQGFIKGSTGTTEMIKKID